MTIARINYDIPVAVTAYGFMAGENKTIRVEDFNRCQGVMMAVSWPYQGYEIADSALYRYYAEVDTTISAITETSPILSEDIAY